MRQWAALSSASNKPSELFLKLKKICVPAEFQLSRKHWRKFARVGDLHSLRYTHIREHGRLLGKVMGVISRQTADLLTEIEITSKRDILLHLWNKTAAATS